MDPGIRRDDDVRESKKAPTISPPSSRARVARPGIHAALMSLQVVQDSEVPMLRDDVV